MRILFASTHDPDDRHLYSGIAYHMRTALERVGAEVITLGPLGAPGAWWMKPRKLAYRLAGREHERQREPRLVRAYADQITAAALAARADVVVGTGVHVVGAITDVPMAYWPDATFAGLYSLYEPPRPFSRATQRNAHALERHALAHATVAAFSSDWARESALADYGADPERVVTIPYGANLDAPPSSADVARAIAHRSTGASPALSLLFVGKDFTRKGGERALEVVQRVNAQGIAARLHVVGPPASSLPDTPYTVAEGFLSAQRPEDRLRLSALYRDAHIFLLPTRADCTPIVLAEAMVHGLPCVASRVGGIPSQVTPESGVLVDPDASADAWASAIASLWHSRDGYAHHAHAARRRYEDDLNWDVAARRFLSAIEERFRTDGGRPRRAAFLQHVQR